VIIHALAAGCDAVIPCLEIDETRRLAASLPAGAALLGGERGGEPIAGFDLGNSPASYTPELCRGKTLLITTTNGTRAILASLEADRVFVAAFVNRKAIFEALTVHFDKACSRPTHLICSGTEGFVSLEDTLFAGSLATSLETERIAVLSNDAAQIAAGLWKNTVRGVTTREKESRAIHDAITGGRGGRNVCRLGLESDIQDAAQVDRFDLEAELFRNPLRIVASHGSST
jgi:2-phosphosulfolactate phosphatase